MQQLHSACMEGSKEIIKKLTVKLDVKLNSEEKVLEGEALLKVRHSFLTLCHNKMKWMAYQALP